ncbi:protein phosphatase 2C domain-containing protein [Tropicimonas sp. TH_r6]|uniref:PP2C family protein-serine/threonine phosphatase n=1 Tax=Tropicimonas sp. TH_r6 TaxID=3082085 RepID=UPI0029542015|nr:protein phosphatase 2C domain-containing protein [Tropicimonas sp. TH_r6]MDV7141150.1 protein phosphatase 2C domain-containing protein [Tropicimonas sp. TH_r6]
MTPRSEFSLDVATGLSLGRRQSQEDAVLCDVPQVGAAGIAVLADGLGGHVAGAVASQLAVTSVREELAGQRDAAGQISGDIPVLLGMAAQAANHAIMAHTDANPDTAGMGATLLATVVQDGRLYWLSIGDSPLFLLRDGDLRQLNEVHSLAPQFDFLARMGEMDAAVAAHHPDRSCLTSALGIEPLRQVDCPARGVELLAGDLILAASDGVLTLSQEDISQSLTVLPESSATDLAERLLARVELAGDAEQDNLSVAVLRALPMPAPVSQAGGLKRLLARLLALGRPSRSRPPLAGQGIGALASLKSARVEVAEPSK